MRLYKLDTHTVHKSSEVFQRPDALSDWDSQEVESTRNLEIKVETAINEMHAEARAQLT